MSPVPPVRSARRALVVLAASSVVALGVTAPAHGARALRVDRPECTLEAGRTELTVTSGGMDRRAVVYVPERVRPAGIAPVVLTLHGSNSGPEEQLNRTGLEATADEHRFIVVAPQGSIALPSGNWAWNVPHVSAGSVDDELFLGDLVGQLVGTGCVDARKVYATGYSGGARMISQTACDRPSLFAAIATVAGLRAGAPLAADPARIDTSTCRPSSAVPVISLSGVADPVNPYAGGGLPYWGYPAETAVARWAELDGCRPRPTVRSITENVTVTTFRGCDGRADVVGYTVADGGHTWPGSDAVWDPALGKVTQEIDANELIWSFFTRHAKPIGGVAD